LHKFAHGKYEEREFALFSFSLDAFAFFALFFLRAFELLFLRARERESARKAPAPTAATASCGLTVVLLVGQLPRGYKLVPDSILVSPYLLEVMPCQSTAPVKKKGECLSNTQRP
jgi:hypothetical protein